MFSRLLIVTITLATCARAAPDRPFVDSNRTELIKAAPELSALEFDSDQSTLDPLLRATGQQLESMLAKFINVSIAEDVHEMRFDSTRLLWKEHRDQFRYVIETRPFVESRNQTPNPQSGFLIAGRFIDMLSDLLPANQSKARFRYLGRITEAGAPSLVVAFILQDGSREGLVLMDEATKRIVRLRTDDNFTRDVRFAPVKFAAVETSLWLPARATVHARFSTGEVHSVHLFSDYQSEGPNHEIGEEPATRGTELDPFEQLVKGVAALAAGKPEDALAPLLDAASRLPDRIEPGYYLGLALYGTHALAEAETQFRETVKRAPNLAAAHNDLGAVLLERGDRAGAVAEAQEALRLEPGNLSLRANLDRAMMQPGGTPTTPAALSSAAAGDVTIQVNVRQVLVPVVVTDKDGHHVTGLTAADFKVFEDGVEQKITAFSSERADVATSAAGTRQTDTADSPGAPKLLAKGRTYVICLDLMHASFSNFVYVREAVRKLFRQEQAGDSEYAVIALGRTMQIIQNTTSDPAKVLETMAESNFKKIYQPPVSQSEIAQYERDLQEVRAACDGGDPSCGPRKRTLPAQADALAEHERIWTAQFLAEFRSMWNNWRAVTAGAR